MSVHISLYDTASSYIDPLSLHDALPILLWEHSTNYIGLVVNNKVRMLSGMVLTPMMNRGSNSLVHCFGSLIVSRQDRKSTRLNSSHVAISYAVLCLKKKKKK